MGSLNAFVTIGADSFGLYRHRATFSLLQEFLS